MVNAPTKTAMPPNTSRSTFRKFTNVFRPSSVKRSWSAAVWTWSESPSDSESCLRTESGPPTRISV